MNYRIHRSIYAILCPFLHELYSPLKTVSSQDDTDFRNDIRRYCKISTTFGWFSSIYTFTIFPFLLPFLSHRKYIPKKEHGVPLGGFCRTQLTSRSVSKWRNRKHRDTRLLIPMGIRSAEFLGAQPRQLNSTWPMSGWLH